MSIQYKTKSVALTQNYWTKILDLDTSRQILGLRSTHATADVNYQFALFPYALDFDGTDDYGTVSGSWLIDEAGSPFLDETGAPVLDEDTDDFITALQDDAEGSIIAEIKIDEIIHTSDRTIVGACKAGSNYYVQFGIDANGYLFAKAVLAGVTQWHVVCDTQVFDLEWHTVKLVHNGSVPKLHIDGFESRTFFVDSTDATVWFGDLDTDLDTFYVGAIDVGLGAAQFFKGLIHSLKIRSGTGMAGTVAAYWKFRDATTSTYGTIDDIASYALEFKATGEPAWASYQPGELSPAGSEFNDDKVPVTSAVWGLTTTAGVTVNVKWGSEGLLYNPL